MEENNYNYNGSNYNGNNYNGGNNEGGQDNYENSQSEEPGKKPKALKVISDVLSGVFLPLLVPTYAFVITMWTTTLREIPEGMRFKASLVIFFLTGVVPLATILFLMKRGKVKDVSINDPKDRPIPYIMTILCYFLAAAYLWRLPAWLPIFFFGAGIAAIIASLLTLTYKVSAHSMSMGALCTILIYTGVNHLATVNILPWIIGAIIASGMVGSARVYLHRHTLGQVYIGWLIGLVIPYLCMNFITKTF